MASDIVVEVNLLVPRFDAAKAKEAAKLPTGRRRRQLAQHAAIAAMRADAPSLRRIILMFGTSRDLQAFEDDTVKLIGDEIPGFPETRAVVADAVAFLSGAIERVHMDIEDFEWSERDQPAVTPANLKLSSDRRRSNLSRIAFRSLRAGTTRSRLGAHLSDANATFASPLPPDDLQSLTEWCIARHMEDLAAKKGGPTHAS